MKIFRNIFRRKIRSLLTISGISVGVFTLIMLGAMAEKTSVQVNVGTKFYETRIQVFEKNDVNSFGLSSGKRPLSLKKLKEIAKVKGVKTVIPQFAMLLDPDQPVTGGSPSMILSGFMGTEKYPEDWKYIEGHGFTEKEKSVAVVGVDLAKQRHIKIGQQIKLHGSKFKVIGILERQLILFDQSVMIPFIDSRRLFFKSLPLAIQKSVTEKDLAMSFLVYIDKNQNNEELAARINREIKEVKAVGISTYRKGVGQLVSILVAIILSIGSIALIIGGLSVVNTMTMSVSERKREIGIKRSMGASSNRIIAEILSEAAVISVIGGTIGTGAGILGILAINSVTTSSLGVTLFMVTARLLAGVVVFSVSLGVIAGLYPAWSASRMNTIAALGYE